MLDRCMDMVMGVRLARRHEFIMRVLVMFVMNMGVLVL